MREKEQQRLEREKRLQFMKKKMERYDYSDNILTELNCQNLSNFYERSKKELEDFRDLFNWDTEITYLLHDEKSNNQ